MRTLYILVLTIGFAVIGNAQKNEEQMSNDKKSNFLGLRTCAYKVPDMNEAKKWYTAAFKTEPYFDEPFYVGFNIGGYELGLMPEENKQDNSPDNILTYWGVENIREAYDHLLSLGATKHEEPHNVGGDIEVASVRDPWDNVIGIIYNPYFE